MRVHNEYCDTRPLDTSKECNPPDPAPLYSVSPHGGPYRQGGSDEVAIICRDIAALTAQRDPWNARNTDRKIKRLKAKLLRFQKKFNRPQVSCALQGLGELADLGENIPAIVGSLTKGVVDVVNVVKPPPKTKPEPKPGIDWTTIGIYAGVVVGGALLYRTLRKKK